MLEHAFRSSMSRDPTGYRRRMASMRELAVMAGAALLLAAVPAHAQDAHGVIAFGEAGGRDAVAYGVACNRDTRDQAREAAAKACVDGGGTDCAELTWFRNGCGALALDQYGPAQGKSGMSREQAEARALKTCEAAGGSVCTVVGSACASPGGEPGAWSGSESVLASREEKPASGRPATSGEEEALTREERVRVQRGLNEQGFEAGPADGMFGRRTRSAIWEWQKAKGAEAAGYLMREQAGALATAGREVRKPAASAEAAESPRRLRTRVLHFPEAGPKCKGMPKGSSCWREIADKTGCFILTNYYIPDYTVSWSGSCEGDTAVGRGVLRRSDLKNPDYSREDSGELLQGKQHGHWVEGWKAGFVLEGPYVDGNRHGCWVIKLANGDVCEGPYVDGKQHGHWVFRLSSGAVLKGPYVDGKQHGHWIERHADDDVSEGRYVDGKKHGRWVIRGPDGSVYSERQWRDGKID